MLPDVRDLRTSGSAATRALSLTKRNGGSGDKNDQAADSVNCAHADKLSTIKSSISGVNIKQHGSRRTDY